MKFNSGKVYQEIATLQREIRTLTGTNKLLEKQLTEARELVNKHGEISILLLCSSAVIFFTDKEHPNLLAQEEMGRVMWNGKYWRITILGCEHLKSLGVNPYRTPPPAIEAARKEQSNG